MTWLTSITNITKSAKMPKEYYSKIRKDQFDDDDSKLRKVLSSHLINDKAYDYLLENEFDEFLEERKKEILKTIADEIGIDYKDDEVDIPTQISLETPASNRAALMWSYEKCEKEFILNSLYLSNGDLKLILASAPELKVKKIRLLTSVKVYNKTLKEFFIKVRDELEGVYKIKCEMRVMSEDIQRQQHARYLADPENCWKTIDYTTATSGKDDEIVKSVKKSFKDLEKWWDDSYDIIDDWNNIEEL